MATTIQSFDPSLLLSYYSARLPVAPQQSSSASGASAKPSATAKDNPPWEATTAPAQQAHDAQVLATTNFLDTSKVPVSAGTASDTKTEQDNQKLFSLYGAVNTLAYLASMSQRTGMTAGQLAGFNTRFQDGLQQVQSYIASTKFNNFALQAQNPAASVTSTVTVPFGAFSYTGSTLVSDANVPNALPGVSAGDSFTISVKKDGATTNVPIDLSQVQGTLSLDNIVNYVNQQLSSAGFGSRLHRTITSGSANDAANASYGIQVNTAGSETVSFSSSAATPALYFAGSTGNAAATADTAVDQQGRLVKLTNLSSSPQGVFSASTKPDSGTSTAQSTVVDANGNVYVVGNTNGDFGAQVNQAAQDVYLSKYDSAGNLQWTKLLGSAGNASGYSLALNPSGGVVVAGSTTSDLTATAVADGNNDSFVAKYDGDGNQTWVKQIQTLADNQAASVSVDASGNVFIGGQVTGSIGAGQTNAGASDGYVAKLDAKGNLVYEKQFGTSAKDQVSAVANTADGGLVVAGVQNGHAIVSKYAGGDATAAPAWQVDLGDLQNGALGGLAVSGNQIYVSGSTLNGALTASGHASVATPSSGSSDAFVFNLTDNGASATANHVSYVGTSAADSAGGMAVGPDGTVYLTGTTKGTFTGQTRNVDNAQNAFVAAIAGDGSIGWTRQYGGADGQSTGQSIAIDTQGSSVLDALGLPRGMIDLAQSVDLTSQTTLRAGDSFQIQFQGVAARNATVTIDKGETLSTLVAKINTALGSNGKASTAYGSGGEGLKIQVNPGVTATLAAGPKDFDALARLGIATGVLTNPSTVKSSSSASSATTSSSAQAFGLGLSGNLDISTTTGAGAARASLLNVLSSVRNVYRTTNTPAAPASAANTQTGGTAPGYLTSQIANYTLALNMLSGGSASSTTSA